MRQKPHSKIQKLQLQSAREKLRLDAARARKAEADAPNPFEAGPNGRPVVSYADMPELRETDMADIAAQFERMACPHAAVATYRPGYEPKHLSEDMAKDCWWFYEMGVAILAALGGAAEGPNGAQIMELISTPEFNLQDHMDALDRFLTLEIETNMKAAIDRAEKDRELAEITAEIEKRFFERTTRKGARFGL